MNSLKNKRSICKDRMINQEAYYKWFDVAKHQVAYVDATSNLAERKNRSLKYHWKTAPFATRNIDQIRESRNWFAVHSFDHLIDSGPTRVKNEQQLRRDQILKLLHFQFQNSEVSTTQLFDFMKGLKKF